MRRLTKSLGAALLALLAQSAFAQGFPAKPVKVVVPWPPGAVLDIMVRAMAAELSPRWNQPIVVENRAGAGSLIGAGAVAQAAPDGYTLMITPINPTLVGNRFTYKSLPFDPDRSFAPISLLAQSSQFVLAHPAVPAATLRELVALSRQQPGKLNYGSWGEGSQPNLVFELMKKRENLDMTHVPYKGTAPVVTAAVAGEIQLTTGTAGSVAALLKSGKLKALAVAGPERSSDFPDIPTSAEAGFAYVQATVRFGMFAPAGTPSTIVERIHTDAAAVLRNAAFAQKNVAANGFQVVASGPQQLAAAIREDVALIGEMVRAAGIKPE